MPPENLRPDGTGSSVENAADPPAMIDDDQLLRYVKLVAQRILDRIREVAPDALPSPDTPPGTQIDCPSLPPDPPGG